MKSRGTCGCHHHNPAKRPQTAFLNASLFENSRPCVPVRKAAISNASITQPNTPLSARSRKPEFPCLTHLPRISSNRLAIVVAAIVSFLFEAIWFTVFMNSWLEGIGRTKESPVSASTTTVTRGLQYATALICSLIAATVLSIAIQATGQLTVLRGVLCAILVWIGFIATSWAKEYIFEVRTIEIFAINTGYSLIDLMLICAIVGAWKKKTNPWVLDKSA
jgi:hypothetical protein